MIKNDLNLEYLKTFRAVALLGGMHRAAEERHMTQPAVTRQMAILSREVGAALFERFGRGVRLTAAGQILLDETEGILRTISEAVQRVREVEGGDQFRLSLGSSHYVAANGLTGPVRTFRKSYPSIRIDFECGSSELMAKKVREGALDIAVATLPSRSEGLRRIPLWRDTFDAALVEGESLTQKTAVTLFDLASREMLLPPAMSTTRALIDRAMRKEGLIASRVIELETLESLAAGVAMDLGVSILPRRLLEAIRSRFPEIVTRPISGFSESRELGILVRRGRKIKPLERVLIDLLERQLGKKGDS